MPSRSVRAYAHRGGTEAAPENSPAAFAAAVAAGYRYLETDVRSTRDGVAVIHHDATLERTTDLTGLVRSRSWSEMRCARFANGESPLRLEDLLEAHPEAYLNIDVKDRHVVAPALDVLHRMNAWDRVCVTSFSTSRLAAVRRSAPRRLETAAGPPEVARVRWGLGRLHLPRRLQVPLRLGGRPFVTPGLVRRAHDGGLRVDVWTVNARTDMEALLDLGVDGIMTDLPSLLREVLSARGLW
ncbi:MAG: glycerophosphodiester phosphodiesterase family protein [Candidatus Nanopelagicales bacterium]